MTDRLKELHDRVLADRDTANRSAAELHRYIADQLESGERTAIEMADMLGVTRSRVYQLARKAQ